LLFFINQILIFSGVNAQPDSAATTVKPMMKTAHRVHASMVELALMVSTTTPVVARMDLPAQIVRQKYPLAMKILAPMEESVFHMAVHSAAYALMVKLESSVRPLSTGVQNLLVRMGPGAFNKENPFNASVLKDGLAKFVMFAQ
jgi:hypothetical protein